MSGQAGVRHRPWFTFWLTFLKNPSIVPLGHFWTDFKKKKKIHPLKWWCPGGRLALSEVYHLVNLLKNPSIMLLGVFLVRETTCDFLVVFTSAKRGSLFYKKWLKSTTHHKWCATCKLVLMPYVNRDGSDQPAHLCYFTWAIHTPGLWKYPFSVTLVWYPFSVTLVWSITLHLICNEWSVMQWITPGLPRMGNTMQDLFNSSHFPEDK